MWYGANGQVGYAWSSDGISWTKSSNNPVLTPGTPSQWGDPVVRFEEGSDGAVLDGFTITGGSTDAGSGLLIANGGSALVANCVITGNQATQGWAGGVWVTNVDATIRNSLIAENVGGGIDVNPDFGPAHLTLEDSILANNDNVGINVNGTFADLTNVLVASNIGTGVSVMLGGEVAIQNSTFSDNYDYGICGDSSSTMTVRNSIVWGNTEGNLSCTGGACTVTYSDVEGGWPGTGNIDADPWFVDAANGDYHLQVGSPCIDAGTSAGAPTHDIEGTPRDAAPDMGAYEWRFRIFLPLTLKNFGP